MEIKYLKSKKGSFSETISWAVATLIIVVMLIVYLFVIAFAKSELKSEIEYRKFLSNSFEREFYTFLDEKVLFEGKNISVKELTKKANFRDSYDPLKEEVKILPEEKIVRLKTFSFMKKQSELIDIEKTRSTDAIYVKVELFNSEKNPFYLLSLTMLSDWSEESSSLNDPYARTLNLCNLNNKDVLFREAFISKDKKITYCFIY